MVSHTRDKTVRMNKWYIYRHDLRKHISLAIFTNTTKLQALEVVQGVVEWLWISYTEEKSPHTIPPYSGPILSTSLVIITVVGMFNEGRFHSDCVGVLIQLHPNLDEGNVSHLPHLHMMGPLNLRQWDIAKSGESPFKELPVFVVDAHLDDFRGMEAIHSFYDAGRDKIKHAITARVLVDEAEQVLEIFLRIFSRRMGTGTS